MAAVRNYPNTSGAQRCEVEQVLNANVKMFSEVAGRTYIEDHHVELFVV